MLDVGELVILVLDELVHDVEGPDKEVREVLVLLEDVLDVEVLEILVLDVLELMLTLGVEVLEVM